jgi:hypothetical protein
MEGRDDALWDKANVCLGVVVGTLKGFDQLMNLVLDEVVESLRGMFFP